MFRVSPGSSNAKYNTSTESKDLFDRKVLTKKDNVYYALIITNTLLFILAIITFFTYTKHLKKECQQPEWIKITSIILYTSLAFCTGRQIWMERGRIHPILDPK